MRNLTIFRSPHFTRLAFYHHHRAFSTTEITMVSSKQQPAKNSKVLIFGAGNFGSCLASHLGDSQHDVFMWAREESLIKHFNLHHRNPAYLKDHEFPPNITAVGPDMPTKDFIDGMDVLLFAIPTQFLRQVLKIISFITYKLRPQRQSSHTKAAACT